MNFVAITPAVAQYLDAQVPERAAELREMETLAARTHFPIIGPAVGNLCHLLTRITNARTVFELGSGFGYSTAWFARGVLENGGGAVHHVVWDEDLSKRAQRHLHALGFDSVVRFQVGEAVQALREADGLFDIIFLDIDKSGYPSALPVITGKLRPGGLLIADNLLWSGRIFDEADTTADTEGIRTFSRMITESSDWSASIIPIRDGVLVARNNRESK